MSSSQTSGPCPATILARMALSLVWASWLGGLMFYAGFVVPVGASVLGSHTEFGFVTRAVTPWLNALGGGVALVLIARMVRLGPGAPARRIGWISIAVFGAAQITLAALHPWLDRLLDPAGREVLDPDAFYLRHRVYLLTTTVAFVALLGHVAVVLAQWSAASSRDSAC